jgi:glycosyltransferase involved in cell wall biosynthesis
MYKPLVSIVMSTYNDARFLRKSVDSVLSQTFRNWEFIIINDKSTDYTDKILKEYQKKDKRIIYIKNKKNLGLTKNLNKGIDLASGDFIARLDGDDYWTDITKLQQQVDFLLDNPAYGIIGCFAHAIDMSDKKLFEIEYPFEDNKIRRIMLRHGPFVHSSVLIRKEILVKIGKYNDSHTYSEDYDLYLNIGRVSKFRNIPKFMVNYRINPLGISRTKYLTQHNEVIKIILKYRKFYPGFWLGFLLWNLRKIYPVWFRGALSRQIKKKVYLLK